MCVVGGGLHTVLYIKCDYVHALWSEWPFIIIMCMHSWAMGDGGGRGRGRGRGGLHHSSAIRIRHMCIDYPKSTVVYNRLSVAVV